MDSEMIKTKVVQSSAWVSIDGEQNRSSVYQINDGRKLLGFILYSNINGNEDYQPFLPAGMNNPVERDFAPVKFDSIEKAVDILVRLHL